MSELKEHLFCECDECIREYRGPLSNEMHPYYLKSEADKVIEEKDAEIAELKAQVHDYAQGLYVMQARAETQLRHSNYKRCLAMAKYCEERCRYLTCLENWQMTDKEYQQVIGGYWDKWYDRWLELAEKFKEAK